MFSRRCGACAHPFKLSPQSIDQPLECKCLKKQAISDQFRLFFQADVDLVESLFLFAQSGNFDSLIADLSKPIIDTFTLRRIFYWKNIHNRSIWDFFYKNPKQLKKLVEVRSDLRISLLYPSIREFNLNGINWSIEHQLVTHETFGEAFKLAARDEVILKEADQIILGNLLEAKGFLTKNIKNKCLPLFASYAANIKVLEKQSEQVQLAKQKKIKKPPVPASKAASAGAQQDKVKLEKDDVLQTQLIQEAQAQQAMQEAQQRQKEEQERAVDARRQRANQERLAAAQLQRQAQAEKVRLAEEQRAAAEHQQQLAIQQCQQIEIEKALLAKDIPFQKATAQKSPPPLLPVVVEVDNLPPSHLPPPLFGIAEKSPPQQASAAELGPDVQERLVELPVMQPPSGQEVEKEKGMLDALQRKQSELTQKLEVLQTELSHNQVNAEQIKDLQNTIESLQIELFNLKQSSNHYRRRRWKKRQQESVRAASVPIVEGPQQFQASYFSQDYGVAYPPQFQGAAYQQAPLIYGVPYYPESQEYGFPYSEFYGAISQQIPQMYGPHYAPAPFMPRSEFQPHHPAYLPPGPYFRS